MDYKELYNKAKNDLENIRVQKAQVQEKINSLVEVLDLDKDKPLKEQVEALKKELEERQKESTIELDRLAEELKKYE